MTNHVRKCQVRKRTLRQKQLRSQRFRGGGLTSSCKQYLQVENKTQSLTNNGIQAKQLKLSLRNIFNMPNDLNNKTDLIEMEAEGYIVRKRITNNESFHHFNDNLAGVCSYFKPQISNEFS